MSPFIISTFAFGHLVMSQNSLFHLIIYCFKGKGSLVNLGLLPSSFA